MLLSCRPWSAYPDRRAQFRACDMPFERAAGCGPYHPSAIAPIVAVCFCNSGNRRGGSPHPSFSRPRSKTAPKFEIQARHSAQSDGRSGVTNLVRLLLFIPAILFAINQAWCATVELIQNSTPHNLVGFKIEGEIQPGDARKVLTLYEYYGPAVGTELTHNAKRPCSSAAFLGHGRAA